MHLYKAIKVGLITTIFIVSPVHAFDINNGKSLHDENCLRCHNETKYNLEYRKIKSYEKLHAQVKQCELMLELAWFEEEVDDVTAYLNQAFYKFDPEK